MEKDESSERASALGPRRAYAVALCLDFCIFFGIELLCDLFHTLRQYRITYSASKASWMKSAWVGWNSHIMLDSHVAVSMSGFSDDGCILNEVIGLSLVLRLPWWIVSAPSLQRVCWNG